MQGWFKEAGQKWSELASNLKTYDEFKEMPRDQRSVRKHFNKLFTESMTKMRKDENSTGTSPMTVMMMTIVIIKVPA